jgi:alginate O-acetyltransferase complex protein AlgI
MIVFMVSGLWHGASWTFVVWGALHGLMLLTERFYKKLFVSSDSEQGVILKFLLITKTFFITSVIWIFFRAESFKNAKDVISALFQSPGVSFSTTHVGAALVFSLLLILTDIFVYNSRIDLKLQSRTGAARWAIYSLLLFCLLALSGTQKFAFIYFQF